MKYKKYRKLFLPKIIVDNILFVHSTNPLKDTNKPSLEVSFAIVNDIISKNDVFNRDENYPFLHIPMYSKYLEVKYGNDYKRHIEWLWLHNIIWFDTPKEGKSTHYYLQPLDTYHQLQQSNNGGVLGVTYSSIDNMEIKPSPLYNQHVQSSQKSGMFPEYCEIRIQTNSQNESFLTRDYTEEAKKIHNAPKHVRAMAQYYKKNLTIDHEGAIKHITSQYQSECELATNKEEKDKAFRKYSSRLSSINAIHQGKKNKSLRFKRNPTNNRVDTNLTNMASDLRPFIVGYSDMTYLDLRNSQPVLFNILLKSKRDVALPHQLEELDRYFDLTVGGKWYEHLTSILNCDRKTAKEAWMVIAYSKDSTPIFKPLKKHFKQHFPYVSQIIEDYKEKEHSKFAIELQKVESKLFIDKICKELVKVDIIPYTFHDAILIPRIHEEQALRVMESVLEKEIGAIPEIKVN